MTKTAKLGHVLWPAEVSGTLQDDGSINTMPPLCPDRLLNRRLHVLSWLPEDFAPNSANGNRTPDRDRPMNNGQWYIERGDDGGRYSATKGGVNGLVPNLTCRARRSGRLRRSAPRRISISSACITPIKSLGTSDASVGGAASRMIRECVETARAT